jgi:hypothetical protein
MSAPKGNVYYLLVRSYKPKSYLPNELWTKATKYFKWNDKHPLKEEKVFRSGYKTVVNKMRTMTISGLCNYACISRETFNAYEKEKDYSDICRRIKEIIYQQKLEGAAADLLNPSNIAREIGLADKREVTGKDGRPVDFSISNLPNISNEDLIKYLNDFNVK